MTYYSDGSESDENIFARIVRGEEQQWRIWDDRHHVAFLTPVPNTPGFTVVVPRKPLSSDIFSLDEDDYIALIKACHEVGHILKESFNNSHGIAIIFEGFEINYAHAKLIPVIQPQTAISTRKLSKYVELYPGFVTSESGPKATAESLEKLHAKIIG